MRRSQIHDLEHGVTWKDVAIMVVGAAAGIGLIVVTLAYAAYVGWGQF